MGLFKRRSQTEGDNGMTIPMKVIVNCETGVVSEIPLTDEEIAQRDIDAANFAAEQAEREAAEAAAQAAKASAEAKLAALGLTSEEIKALA